MVDRLDLDDLIVQRFNIRDDGSLPLKSNGRTRKFLAQFMGEIGYTIGAEIGVMKGKYSKDLCTFNPNLRLKCVDPWLSFRNSTEDSYLSFRRTTQKKMDVYYRWACERLKNYNVEIIRKTSMEAVRDIADESLDFVYIDANHQFDYVMLDLICWSKKVRIGGMISGHDYSPIVRYIEVTPAVDIYTKMHSISKWYITDEPEPSFFWVKR